MGIYLEGTQVDTVTIAPGQLAVRTYRVAVGDGRLTLPAGRPRRRLLQHHQRPRDRPGLVGPVCRRPPWPLRRGRRLAGGARSSWRSSAPVGPGPRISAGPHGFSMVRIHRNFVGRSAALVGGRPRSAGPPRQGAADRSALPRGREPHRLEQQQEQGNAA